MARRKIREHDAKRLLAARLRALFPGQPQAHLDLKVAQVSQGTDFIELLQAHPWLGSTRLVVKPDMLFGQRGKHDLVGLNLAGGEVRVRARGFGPAPTLLLPLAAQPHTCTMTSYAGPVRAAAARGTGPHRAPPPQHARASSTSARPPPRPPPAARPPTHHTPPQAEAFIRARMGKPVTVNECTGPVTTFIVEPFLPHKEEMYLSLQVRVGSGEPAGGCT